MASIATVSIRDHIDTTLLTELARLWSADTRCAGFPADELPALPDTDEELEPFEDWDAHRGHGRGFFHGDARECASRRIDLRGPTDLDPGPLPMEEAPPDVTGSAWHLTFRS